MKTAARGMSGGLAGQAVRAALACTAGRCMIVPMTDTTRPSDIQREHRAQRDAVIRAFLAYSVIILGFWVVNSLSNITEAERGGGVAHVAEIWFLEGTSTAFVLLLFWPISWLESRYPVGETRWPVAIPVHVIGSLAFSAIHVGGIALARDGLWPLLFDGQYDFFGDGVGLVFVYEYRKDVMAYAVILFLLYIFRTVEQHRMDAEAARREAQVRHRVTLKCGGRTVLAEADGFLFASAAGNYVEATFATGTHFARLTLRELETQLRAAQVDAVRVHRSFIVNRSAIAEIAPTGEGDVVITLTSGAQVPGSRRYRAALEG